MRGKPESKVTVYRAVPFEKTRDEQIAGLERDMADYMRRKKIPASYSGEGNYYDWASAERQRLQSLPDGADKKPYPINAGDWVTTSKDYAKEHGLGALGGNFKIVKKTVPAGQLYTSGDSILEFGYDPTGLGIQGGTGSGTNTPNINRFETEADRRMAAAQRNAALPFDQGGLGLPAGNTPEERALAMGFDIDNPMAHGTDKNIKKFKVGKKGYDEIGGGVYTAPINRNPYGYNYSDAWAQGDGGINYPLVVKRDIADYDSVKGSLSIPNHKDIGGNAISPPNDIEGDLIARIIERDPQWSEEGLREQMRTILKYNGADGVIKKAGYAGARSKNSQVPNQVVTFDPKNVRSRFAAFDPMRRNESDILALNGQKTGSGLLNPEITKATNRGLYRTMLDDEEDKPSFPYGLIGK